MELNINKMLSHRCFGLSCFFRVNTFLFGIRHIFVLIFGLLRFVLFFFWDTLGQSYNILKHTKLKKHTYILRKKK